MIYKLNDKYYIKVSGYLIEVKPTLIKDELDFKPTENKIEITPDLIYKSVDNNTIKNELKNEDSKLNKVSERTHSKFKFDYKD